MKNKNILHQLLRIVLIIGLLLFPMKVQAAPRVQETGAVPVIVIDPGHGGSNEGTLSGNTKEKEMCLITAKAMYDELCKYDGIQVYMTRTADVDMTLKERAEYAASVNADFLFSLHFNASENHTMYGSEVWISSVLPYHAYGYQFGYAYLTQMQKQGMFLRGVKTRLGDDGTDYYGIIRESVTLSVPAVIIEHCYVDHERDTAYCATEEQWKELGRNNAHIVAGYFGLSGTEPGVNSQSVNMSLPEVDIMQQMPHTQRDTTAPDVCMLELLETDYNTGDVSLKVTATDYDSALMYYDYSLDGGETFSALEPWPEFDALAGTYRDTFTLHLQIPANTQPAIILRAYNTADLDTESNQITFLHSFATNKTSDKSPAEVTFSESAPDIDKPIALQEKENTSIGTTTFLPASAASTEETKSSENTLLSFLQISLAAAILILLMVIITQCINSHKRRKRRHQRIKELESQTYQPK